MEERGTGGALGGADAATRAGLPTRIGWLLLSPATLFDRLRARPAWLDALLLLVALNVVGNLILPDELLRRMAESQLPADADPTALEGSVRFLRLSSLLGAVVFTPLWAVVVAAYLVLVYDVVLGGEAGFRRLFSASTHALLVLALGGLLTLALVVARGDIQTALALHLVVPGLEAGGWLYRFLHGLNVFGLWTAAVLGIGVSRLYPRRRAGPAAAFLIATYVLLKAGAAFVPALGGA